MAALLIGVVFILFSVFSVIPGISWGLGWGPEVITVLKGGAPIIAVFIGLIAIFIGIADIKDKMEAKKEEAEEAEEAEGKEKQEE